MLNSLFGSPARVKILKMFLSQPEARHYLRQLARDLDLQVNSVRREIINLESIGLISLSESDEDAEAKDKEKKYYIANKDFLLFNELRALFIKAQILNTQEFIDEVQKVCTPEVFILSGYFVGDAKAVTDLMLVGDIDKHKFSKIIKKLEKSLSLEINYTIFTVKEYLYRLEVMDIFLNGILSGKKNMVVNSLEDNGKN